MVLVQRRSKFETLGTFSSVPYQYVRAGGRKAELSVTLPKFQAAPYSILLFL